MRRLRSIGIVGAGTMGAAIAQKCAQEGFRVILVDRTTHFVEKGLQMIRLSLEEGMERRIFTPLQVETYLSNVKGTASPDDLKDCDLVIEAVFEDFHAKQELFESLSAIVADDCIIATNTSSFSITQLSGSVSHPDRFLGLHFFYHAAKNRLVEIIPGKHTASNTIDAIRKFTILLGKDAITCKDSYGFVVNRFFVPWLNEATRLLEEGVAEIAEIDFVCKNVFGIGMGPFALMNATGISVALHAEKTLEIFGELYKVSDSLQRQAQSGRQWDLENNAMIRLDPQKEKKISDRMLGVVFFVCLQILEEKVSSATHLNRGAKIGLQWKNGPVDLLRSAGGDEVNRLVKLVSNLYRMRIPASVGEQNAEVELVRLEKKYPVAVLTIDQPENLNALSEQMFQELSQKFDSADTDSSLETIFITGSGKAFVAGADIKFFVNNINDGNLNNIESFTREGQKLFNRIDHSEKKVIAIINGLTLGGGLELALCADLILAMPNAQFAFPETGIGIYPGLGGTQRCARKIGKGLSKYLIHTGKVLSAEEARDIGLVDQVISLDDAFDIMAGNISLPFVPTPPLSSKWKNIQNFFEQTPLSDILDKTYLNPSLHPEEVEKIVKTISYKAPIAVKLADKLIDEEKGCESELTHLKEIFSTSDALLGLTSIGKKVQYQGK